MPVVDCEGRTCKRVISKSSVPWYKDFKSVGSYRSLLEEEADAFWSFDNEPRAEHAALLDFIESTGECYAVMGGAAAIGVHLSEVAMKIDVAFPPSGEAVTPFAAQQAQLIGMLAERPDFSVTEIRSDREFVVEAAPGCPVHITLWNPSFATLSRRLQREASSDHNLKKITKVLGQVLRQSNLLNSDNGGIHELGLVMLILSALTSIQREQVPDDNGTKALLLLVLEHLGNSFDHTSKMATVAGPAPRLDAGLGKAPVNKKDPASIMAPVLFALNPAEQAPSVAPCAENGFLSDYNLTNGCTRFVQVREVFKYCLTMLVKWQHTGNTKQSGKMPYSYKGKSPLSSIISFKHLVQKEKECAAQQATQRGPADLPARGRQPPQAAAPAVAQQQPKQQEAKRVAAVQPAGGEHLHEQRGARAPAAAAAAPAAAPAGNAFAKFGNPHAWGAAMAPTDSIGGCDAAFPSLPEFVTASSCIWGTVVEPSW